MRYFVCEIGGKQYLLEEGKTLTVGRFASAQTKIKIDQVLMKVEDGKIELGSPYLKEGVELDVLGTKRQKIRVAKYSAKANSRRVTGSVISNTTVRLSQGKSA